jgi:hypothetical protein
MELSYTLPRLLFSWALPGLGAAVASDPERPPRKATRRNRRRTRSPLVGKGRERKTHRYLVEMDDAFIGASGGTQRTVVVLVSKTR